MRVGATRAMPVARSHARRVDLRLSPIVAQRSTSARAGVQIGGGGVAFLVVYLTLQLLNALGHDPRLVAALAPIPLFARFVASAACALLAGAAVGHLVRDHRRWLRILPTLLATAIALFVVAIALLS